MLIAITAENNMVYQHFGHSPSFMVYEVENKEIRNKSLLSADGKGHSALATLLGSQKIDVLICGGIGEGARVALGQQGVKVIPGTTGDVDEVINAYLSDTLQYQPDFVCHDHDHESGGGHACGEHGCH